MSMKIGVFDSGIGGLAVAEKLQLLLPGAVIITVNDSQNVPYGDKTPDEIYRLTDRAIQPLLEASCDAIVIACNTATMNAVSRLRDSYPEMPFVGLDPMVKPAAAASRSGVIAVCATPATLASSRYQELKKEWAQGVRIIEPDCSSWAQKIEQHAITDEDIVPVLASLETQEVDAIVLGCTHYHWIVDDITRLLSNTSISIYEPSMAVAQQVLRLLAR